MLSQYQNFTQIKRIHIWTKLRAHSRCMHRAQISQVTQIRSNTVQTYASLSSSPLSILIENPQSSTLPTIQQCQASVVRPSKTPLCTHRAQIFRVAQIRLSRVQTYTSLSSHSPFDPLWKPQPLKHCQWTGTLPSWSGPAKFSCAFMHRAQISRSYKYAPVRYRPTPPFLHTHCQSWQKTPATQAVTGFGSHKSDPVWYRSIPLFSHPLSILTENSSLSSSLWTQVIQIWPSKVQTYTLFFTPIVSLDRKPWPLKHCHWTQVRKIWPSTVQTYTPFPHPLSILTEDSSYSSTSCHWLKTPGTQALSLTENSRHSSSHWTRVTQIWPSTVETYTFFFSTPTVNLDRRPRPLKH